MYVKLNLTYKYIFRIVKYIRNRMENNKYLFQAGLLSYRPQSKFEFSL
jgi:hypothetical protein